MPWQTLVMWKTTSASSQVSRTPYLCYENLSDTQNKYFRASEVHCSCHQDNHTAVKSRNCHSQLRPGSLHRAKIITALLSTCRFYQMSPSVQKNGKQTDGLVVHPNIVLHPQKPASPTFVKFYPELLCPSINSMLFHKFSAPVISVFQWKRSWTLLPNHILQDFILHPLYFSLWKSIESVPNTPLIIQIYSLQIRGFSSV